MKRFQWRLQRVLDIKQKEEQVKRSELLDITQRLSQMRGELFIQKRIIDDLIDTLSEETPQNRLEQQAFFMTHSRANNEEIKRLECNIEVMAQQQQEKKEEVLAIKRLNEGLDKLRSQAEKEFFETQQKIEQKELDEAATSRFARKILHEI